MQKKLGTLTASPFDGTSAFDSKAARRCVSGCLLGIGLLAPLTARADEDSGPPQVHGFVSQGYIKTTSDNNYLAVSKRGGSFEFTEVGLNFTKHVSDQLRVGVQLFAHDLGPLGNLRPQFDWFYFDYRFWDWLGVRGGRTKLPFGLYNESNDIDAGRVPILLPQSVYPIENRDFLLAQTGGEIYGNVRMGAAGVLEYRAYGGTIFIDAANSTSTLQNLNVPYVFGARLMWQTPLDGLQAGASVQALRLDFDYIPPPAPQAALMMPPAAVPSKDSLKIPAILWVTSLEYAAGDLLLATEYSRWHSELQSSAQLLLPNSRSTSERYYAMGSYRVAPWLSPGLYYSVLFPHINQRSGREAFQHDVAATLRFDLDPHWLLKLEGHFMHGTAALSSPLNDNKPLSTLSQDWGALLVKTTAYF